MVIEYVEAWLQGRGAKGIDSLAGKPGVHPALMEDLATGRMSVAQIAQRIRHRVTTTRGPAATHDAALVKRLLQEECEDILRLIKNRDAQTEERYRKSVKIAQRWIKNYVDLDYRSLGSYTRGDLDRLASEPDAL
jgi:malate synthase